MPGDFAQDGKKKEDPSDGTGAVQGQEEVAAGRGEALLLTKQGDPLGEPDHEGHGGVAVKNEADGSKELLLRHLLLSGRPGGIILPRGRELEGGQQDGIDDQDGGHGQEADPKPAAV